MEGKEICERVVGILSSKSDSSESLSNLVKVVHVPKKALNHELYKLEKQNIITKIQDTPPIWKLLETETGQLPTFGDSGNGPTTRRRSTRDGKSSQSPSKSPKKVESVVTKDAVCRVQQFLQGRKTPTRSLVIAKGLGFSKAADVNNVLYFMEKKKFLERHSDKPRSWFLVHYGEIEDEMFGSEMTGMNVNVSHTQVPEHIAGNMPGATDGGLPAFQDTVLFNTDLSFESDETELFGTDDKGDKYDNSISINETVSDEAETSVSNPDDDSNVHVDNQSSMDALSKFTSLQQSQLWSTGQEPAIAGEGNMLVTATDNSTGGVDEDVEKPNEPFVNQSKSFQQAFRVDEAMSGASSLESTASTNTVESPEVVPNTESLFPKSNSEPVAETVSGVTENTQTSNTPLSSGSVSSVLQTPNLVDMVLGMEDEKCTSSQTAPTLVKQSTDVDKRMESAFEDIEEPLPGFKEVIAKVNTSDSEESDTFASELRKFTTGNSSKRFKADITEVVNDEDNPSVTLESVLSQKSPNEHISTETESSDMETDQKTNSSITDDTPKLNAVVQSLFDSVKHLETKPKTVLDLNEELGVSQHNDDSDIEMEPSDKTSNAEHINSVPESSNSQRTFSADTSFLKSDDHLGGLENGRAGKQVVNKQDTDTSQKVDITDKEIGPVLKALSSCPMFSGTTFVLKMKTKLTEEKLNAIMEKLKTRNLVMFNSRKLWELTEEGKRYNNEGSSATGKADSHNVSEDLPVPPARKKPAFSGPPPSPFAIIKQKGLGHEAIAKSSSMTFNESQKSVISKANQQNVTPNLFAATKQQSEFPSANHNLNNMSSHPLPSSVSNQVSSLFSSSRSSVTKPTPSVFPSSSSIVKPAPTQQLHTGPKPLMSLKVDSQPVQSNVSSNIHTNVTTQSMPRFQNSMSSVSQTTRPGQVGMAAAGSNVKHTNQFSASSLFDNKTSYDMSGFQDSQASVRASQFGMTGVTSNIPAQKINSLKKPSNTSFDPPKLVIPEKYADYPNQKRVTVEALKGGFANRNSSSKANQQPGAFAKRPPPSPADMLAKVMKKTEISPPRSIQQPSQISFTQSNTGSFQTASSSGTRPVPQTPQSLLGLSFSSEAPTGNYSSVSVSRTGIVNTTTQSVTRNLLNLANQSGVTHMSQTGRPTTKAIQTQPAGNTQTALALSTESFNALNKNPVSALMEYAQNRKMMARIEVIGRHGASHKPKFQMAAFVGSRQFPAITCSNKKDGKKEACDIALRTLVAEGQFNQSGQNSQLAKPAVAPSNMTHFDKIAALTHRGFTALVSQISSDAFAGRKVVAGLVMKRSQEDTGVLISLGTGNRCITGNQLSLEGNTVNDSHAEIITRRGFIRFLYTQLEQYDPSRPSPMFEKSPSGKLRINPGITFHLYISTAPCGDGALFSPRDTAATASQVDTSIRPPHEPTFTSNVQGLLRTKVEGGEGTIPIDPGFKGQTFDGIQRGERLLTMSCTDKVCRWNVVGMQGALLSHFLDPIYLDSFTLGMLYDHGHLARALCCRVVKNAEIDSLLPRGYRLNHPWLGRVTVCEVPREVQKTKSLSINWCFGDKGAEVTDGTLGLNYTCIEKSFFSRCSKRNLYESFKKICQKFGYQKLLQVSSYKEAKMAATDFQAAREAMLRKFKENKCGVWVSKPVEEEMFT